MADRPDIRLAETGRARCNAPWYELNVSAPDGRVSACCFYRGETQAWDNETAFDLDHYWNAPQMQALREIQSGRRPVAGSGCEGCFYFSHRGADETYAPYYRDLPADLRPAQRAARAAMAEAFESGRVDTPSRPLRYYFDFGFGCNLSCIMCHQVPRRETVRVQLGADLVLRWKSYLKVAEEVWVIGGEPFVIPEALKFVRAFADDPELHGATLYLYTNATVLHKHYAMLRRIPRLSLIVSLDSMGDAFEHIRADGDWSTVDANIREFLRIRDAERPYWRIQTANILMRSGLAHIEDFVRWHISLGIQPSFMDFINAAGIEKAFAAENLFAHPLLLDTVPGWRDRLDGAVALLREAGWAAPADLLAGMTADLADRHAAASAAAAAPPQRRLGRLVGAARRRLSPAG